MVKSSDILGWMLDGDYDVIDAAVAEVSDKDFIQVLEIGTLFGKSAVAFDEALKDKPHNIITLDICLGWIGPTEEQLEGAVITSDTRTLIERCRCDADEQFKRIQQSIEGRNIEFRQCFWTKHFECDKTPDIVFYDGMHSYEETVDVLDCYSECPVIIIDDYIDRWNGVQRAVDEYLERTGRVGKSFDDSKMMLIL